MRLIILTLSFLASLVLPAHAEAQSMMERLQALGGSRQADVLPPDQAFGLEVRVHDGNTLVANFKVTPGYYLYRDRISFKIKDDASQTNGIKPAGITVGEVIMPQGEMKLDPNFGNMIVYRQSFQSEVRLSRSALNAQPILLEAEYQGCKNSGLCYAPITKKYNLSLPIGMLQSTLFGTSTTASASTSQAAANAPLESENSKIASLFKQANFFLIVLFFFGAGLLLAFTPCVLPMIPILSGIIAGSGISITRMHGFLLALAYVMGMALTYTGAGVAAGLSGELLSSALQTPWVLGSFAAIFVVLSLSMFGFYELQLPSALQSKLSNSANKIQGGQMSGVFLMGALSAIIVSPCVAAPMAASLLYISQTHDAVLGGVALFTMALGMGTPLLLIGASAGALLPRAGGWMETIKQFFGVLMLAVAIWLISTLIPLAVEMLLWAILLIASAIYLNALDALPPKSHGWRKVGKGIGVLILLLGISMLVGALSGAKDILRPLGALGGGQVVTSTSLPFVKVKNIAELDNYIAQAQGKMVMLDFYADWCVSCKEMERFTFPDAKIQAKLSNTLLLKADVTANNDEDKALLKRFGLFGPPGILFFDKQGREQVERRVIGFQNSAQFLTSLEQAGL
ncbi:MAG: protein-disulfide reductase DsbD [Candidatus Nitrotoga sp.]